MPDFALQWDPALGAASLALCNDDLESDAGLHTAVMLSLFTDQRAEADDPLPAEDGDRRGWLGDELSEIQGDRIGSRLWLLDRSKLTQDVVRRAEEYARQALAWMLEDRVAARLDVVAEAQGQLLAFSVAIVRPTGQEVSFRFDHLWGGEAVRQPCAEDAIEYPTNGMQLAAWMGHGAAPSSLWRLGQTSGNPVSDLVGTNTLTPSGALVQGVADTALGHRAVVLADGETHRLVAASSSVLNATTGDLALFLLHRVTASPGAQRALMGKRANGAGYELTFSATDQYQFLTHNSLTSLTHSVDGVPDGSVVGVLCVRDAHAHANQLHVWANGVVASSAATAVLSGSMTNGQTFALGPHRLTSPASRMSMAAVWDGTNARGLNAAKLHSLMRRMGFR